MRAPEVATAGIAEIALSMEGWKEGDVAPWRGKIEILAAPKTIKLEPVSSRLKRELIHPNRDSRIGGLFFSPDSSRILAGDVESGVIQVWDAHSGKQLTKIELGPGCRGSSGKVEVSPDWSRLYVGRNVSNVTQVVQDGKKLLRYDYDGDVGVWDLHSGQIVDRWVHPQRCGVVGIAQSPDRSVLITYGYVSTEPGQEPKSVTSLWDVRTGKHRDLPQGWFPAFSQDGKNMAISTSSADGLTSDVNVIDVATLAVNLTIPIREEFARAGVSHFANDGQVLVGQVAVYAARNDYKNARYFMRFWDTQTGKEISSLPLEVGRGGMTPIVSPDGKTVAHGTLFAKNGHLRLYEAPTGKLRREIRLSEGESLDGYDFSPDGKWLAYGTQVYPEFKSFSDLSAEDMPQPRIHLLDLASGEVKETLISQQTMGGVRCFSPDGKTLATAGNGKVLLWNFSTPPGP